MSNVCGPSSHIHAKFQVCIIEYQSVPLAMSKFEYISQQGEAEFRVTKAMQAPRGLMATWRDWQASISKMYEYLTTLVLASRSVTKGQKFAGGLGGLFTFDVSPQRPMLSVCPQIARRSYASLQSEWKNSEAPDSVVTKRGYLKQGLPAEVE
ncbi:hypothetical protein FGO68_gene12421 [Halteria grandinella]|uniref:Uncharacterized protein n=1 Tax=Halteria grandinella TaxID=5974 RepID=A0A8J8T9P7_HALGN|nr:hypothetical protein FGO68_gene12421 [Halteria grandinella]